MPVLGVWVAALPWIYPFHVTTGLDEESPVWVFPHLTGIIPLLLPAKDQQELPPRGPKVLARLGFLAFWAINCIGFRDSLEESRGRFVLCTTPLGINVSATTFFASRQCGGATLA